MTAGTELTTIERLQHFLQDEIATSRQLHDENTRLRETLGDRDEHIERLQTENSSCHSTINAYRLREERRKSFLRNPDLIPMEKLVALEALEEVERKRINLTDTTSLTNERIAAKLGTSSATVGKTFVKLDKMEVLHYTQYPTECRGESYYTPVSVTFTDLVNDPASIRKDPQDKPGGARERRCANPNCRSENIDTYTVQYCRDCQKAGWYGQVGLRHDANVLDAMKAAGRGDAHIDDELKSDVEAQPFHIYHDGFCEKPPDITPDKNILSSYGTIPEHDKMIEDAPVVEDVPLTPPQTRDADSILTNWLQDRLRNPDPVRWATGSLVAADKYKTKHRGYQPDIAAYLRGDPAHIYASKLRDPEGLTAVLCFEIDQPEHNALATSYLIELTAAGAFPIYWQRARQRGHLEIYFDAQVDPEAARAWCLSVCPQLRNIPECFPALDRANNALSWPLWQRIGNEVTPCSAYAMRGDDFIGADIQDSPDELAQLITQAVTPCSLIPALQPAPVALCTDAIGGGLMEKKEQDRLAADEKDLARQVIADFNRSYSWEDIAALCGGMIKGKFCAIWRGDRSPSVVPDNGGRSDLAIDYGRTGNWPRKFDKYQVWCMAQGIDRKADLAIRCEKQRRDIV